MSAELDIASLQETVVHAAKERKISRGVNNVRRSLEQGPNACCILADDCDQGGITSLIEALAREANVPLIKVQSQAVLAEWAGLARFDDEGNATRVPKCSTICIRQWPTSECAEKVKAYVDGNK